MKSTTSVLATLSLAGLAIAHTDDPKEQDRMGPWSGEGWIKNIDAPLRAGTFDQDGEITLQAWLSLSDFGNPSTGNDCWGYVSPSGREYGIVGHSDGTVFVEVTNPAAPVIIQQVSGPNSLWRDMKVFGEHCYIVSEGGDGIQVVDMTNIDDGVVSHVNTVTTGGTTATHNVVINTDSGYLYRTGGGDNGLRIYDLNANPVSPTYVGAWTYKYVHDAQVVTYPDGTQYAGREIAFCYAGFNSGWNETGLTIVDVTDKSNMFIVSELQHSSNYYSHQGWITEDYQHIYLNDELDEQSTGSSTTTRILDVSNLENPVQVGTCTTGLASVDHNLYIRGDRMYQANYRSGLRIWDISNRVNPTEIAWFDTYPGSDSAQFNGIWSNYPFLPSGTIIGSDLERGMFVWTTTPPVMVPTVLDPMPTSLDPDGGDSFRIQVSFADGVSLDEDASFLRWNDGSGWVSAPLQVLDGGNPMMLRAMFGPSECGTLVDFEAVVAADEGTALSVAADRAPSADGNEVTFEDDCETNPGWTVENACTDGQWARGIPAGGGVRGDPASDGDNSGACWLTDNVSGNSDVDGGTTTLISPTLDASNEFSILEYTRWYSNDYGAAPNADVFTVDVSDDAGATWTTLEVVGPAGPECSGGWYTVEFDLASVAGLELNDQFRIRFIAEDASDGSVIEAAVDGIRVSSTWCDDEHPCPGDFDGNNVVDVDDLLELIGNFGDPYTVNDILITLANFGAEC